MSSPYMLPVFVGAGELGIFRSPVAGGGWGGDPEIPGLPLGKNFRVEGLSKDMKHVKKIKIRN